MFARSNAIWQSRSVQKLNQKGRILPRILFLFLFGVGFRHFFAPAWLQAPVVHSFFSGVFLINGGIKPGWIYIDVGSNHPTTINDTFLFYRKGYSGVCIEPNRELIEITRTFRPRDVVLNAAASNSHSLLSFYETKNHVFSSVDPNAIEDEVVRSYLVPVICLDDLTSNFPDTKIFLLKIDTEGFDQKVLMGAKKILQSTMVVLSETKSEEERQEQAAILGSQWKIFSSNANTIFVNSSSFDKF